MDKKVTIWGVNMAAELMEPYQDEIIQALDGKVQFGDRRKFMRDSSVSIDSSINLMPDTEYFVPIAPKCLGNYIKTAEGDTAEIISNIVKYYKDAGQKDYTFFWEDECMTYNGYQMLSDACMGYYEILEQTAPNILVGYSQGGLVVRYLAWLDQCVFKKNVIQSVITVSGAVFGSPLANSDNKNNILDSITQILNIILEAELKIVDIVYPWYEKYPIEAAIKVAEKILKMGLDHGIAFILQVLKNLNNELEKLGRQDVLHGYIRDAINWLGGVDSDVNGAFYDLNIKKIDDKYSVLSSVHSVQPEIPYAGILSCSNDVYDILELLLNNSKVKHLITTSVVNVAASSIAKDNSAGQTLKEHGVDSQVEEAKEKVQQDPGVQAAEGVAANESSDPRIDQIIRDASQQIKVIYDGQLMVEKFTTPVSNPIINKIVDYHTKGIPALDVAPGANDLVIPSAYQLDLYNGEAVADNTIPNQYANHLTGSSPGYEPGKANYQYILELLKKFV